MRVKQAGIAAVVMVPLLLVGLGVADVAAFQSRASRLEKDWHADEAVGVSHAQLAPAFADLQSTRDRRIALIPWSVFSLAVLLDPFTSAESRAAAGQAEALAAARQRARDALARLGEVGGPNYAGQPVHASELARASRLTDYLRLAGAWEAEADLLASARDQLAQASGGLSGGLPADVVDGTARLQVVMSTAGQANLSPDPAPQALSDAQAYLTLMYPEQMRRHADMAAEVRAAADRVQHRVGAHAQASLMVGQLPGLLAQAAKYGVSASFPSQADQARASLSAAEASGDDAQMDAAAAQSTQVVDALSAAVAQARQKAAAAAAADVLPCIAGAPAQLIMIHLTTQSLVAYENGCPVQQTLVTTGQVALPTDRGTFQIYAKFPTYHMISPWPPSSPFWYKDAWVDDAMEFVSDGTFIHGASWEPNSAYGPGSEYGPYASHGCVHVQAAPLATLYAWAQIGATVQVGD
jgi:lipoprotein-anchoring transpeptidase ErfK/SrfK